jgi:hypothetical protein
MTVLVRYSPASLSRETYDRVEEVLRRRAADGPPRELALHVLFGAEPALRVSEIWESEEAWRHFRTGLLAEAFEEVGFEMPEPEVLAVHAMWGSAVKEPAAG